MDAKTGFAASKGDKVRLLVDTAHKLSAQAELCLPQGTQGTVLHDSSKVQTLHHIGKGGRTYESNHSLWVHFDLGLFGFNLWLSKHLVEPLPEQP